MGADEEGTLARLKAHRRGLIDPKIAEYRGRIVKTTGDGMLVAPRQSSMNFPVYSQLSRELGRYGGSWGSKPLVGMAPMALRLPAGSFPFGISKKARRLSLPISKK